MVHMSDNELVAVDTASTAPSLVNQFDIVDVDAAAAFMQNYQDLVNALLEPSDYQTINGKPKKKKSAWRKLATAFNISDDIVKETIIREDDHQIISAWFMVKATLPNGRSGIGVGDCSIFDKIKNNDTEMPSNFELRKRFNNAEHDILTTAHTRAKSRAIADLVGGGEVSAEELSGMSKTGKPVKPSAPKPTKPKTKGKTSTMGMKPRTPKVEDEAIEVEAKEVKSEKPNLKTLVDTNTSIRLAVDELQSTETVVNRNTIQDKLMDLWDMGKVTDEEYKTAKTLLE